MSRGWDDAYRKWLESIVEVNLDSDYETHHMLIDALDKVNFSYYVREDINRADDGVYLRTRFMQESGMTPSYHIRTAPCTMLEMLVALAERMFFASPDEDLYLSPRDTFIEMMKNLDLWKMWDDEWTTDPAFYEELVFSKCHDINNRTYNAAGEGGIFPLYPPLPFDSRETELWYQTQEYLIQKNLD